MNKVTVILLVLLFAFFGAIHHSTVELARSRAAMLSVTSPDDPALCNMREPDCGQ